MTNTTPTDLETYLTQHEALTARICTAVTTLRDGIRTENERGIARSMTLLQEAKDAIALHHPPDGLRHAHNLLNRALSLLLEAARAGMQGITSGDASRAGFAQDRITQATRLLQTSAQEVTALAAELDRRSREEGPEHPLLQGESRVP